MWSVSCNCVHSCKTAGSAVGEVGMCIMMQGGEHEHPCGTGRSCITSSTNCDCLLAFDLNLNHSPRSGRSISAGSRKIGMEKPQLPQLMLAYAVRVAKAQSNP